MDALGRWLPRREIAGVSSGVTWIRRLLGRLWGELVDTFCTTSGDSREYRTVIATLLCQNRSKRRAKSVQRTDERTSRRQSTAIEPVMA